LISFSTIGLSDFHPSSRPAIQPPLWVEILGVSENEQFADVLASTAFYAIKHDWLLSPGTVVLSVVATDSNDPALQHLLMVDPFLWVDGFHSREFPTKTVAWVLGVPVSQAETEYLH
jgi:hypothetical protein